MIVYFSFYFNLKIVRFFCRTLYKSLLVDLPVKLDVYSEGKNIFNVQVPVYEYCYFLGYYTL